MRRKLLYCTNQTHYVLLVKQTSQLGADLAAFEKSYRQQAKEVSDLHGSTKGYPNKDDLSGDDKLLWNWIGIPT